MSRPAPLTAGSAFDACVIGGGPAGSTAARLLAEWGHRVALLTRPPTQDALAESLPPSCVHLLERLGLREAVDAAGFVRSSGNTVWWASSAARVEPFALGRTGYQVSRSAFDALLLARSGTAGVAVHAACSVKHVSAPNAEGVRTVAYHDVDGAHELTARWVIDATGRAGLLARQWRVPDDATRTTALLGVWAAPAGWALPDWTHTTIESFGDGWAWSIPLSETERVVTVMVDPRLTPIAGARLEAAYRAELAKATRHAAQVSDARLVQAVWACDASPYHATRVSAPGLLVAGDAASFIDPLSSFGVKKALASGWLAAVVVNTALRAPERSAPALELFEARERDAHAALRARVVEVAREVAASGAHRFWAERAEGATSGSESVSSSGRAGESGELDVEILKRDPKVLAAFEELRRRETISLAVAHRAGLSARPTVEGNEVVLRDHLTSPALPHPARYVRNIDLVALAQIATTCRGVPDIIDSYNEGRPPAPLPDLLGALSVLIGCGVLEFA